MTNCITVMAAWRGANLVENELYTFDDKAASRAVKFIETYLSHFEGEFEGKPFLLMEWQSIIIRDLFGWKRKDNGLRRFRELYLEIPKGNGKSPLMAAIGCYMFFADGEAGARVISAATGFEQAKVTFEAAKAMVQQHAELSSKCDVLERIIKGPKNSVWQILSGDGNGKAGPRPSCLLLDEAHEWPNGKMYNALRKNSKKRDQPLILVATNSGHRKDTICWELHERAQRILDGISKDDTLYPVIYGSSEKDNPYDPKLWEIVNPALGTIVKREALEEEAKIAKEHPAQEAEFRRLNIGQWVQGSAKWLDMSQWDSCATDFSIETVTPLPLWLGLDMSLNDDLTALAFVWIGPDKLYTKCKFWLPLQTSREYEEKDSIPFAEWSRNKHITLIDAQTIDPATQLKLANFIIKLKEKYNLKGVCYDRNRASNVIALLEAAKITCVPIAQNWEMSPACEELTRRIKDKTIVIKPNPVLRWNAANVEAKADNKGNIHLIKEARLGSYRGRRSQKIDGATALVTALTQVRKELMQPQNKVSVYESRGVFCL